MAPKAELVRIAVAKRADSAALLAVHDAHGTMPGRGAYLCRAQPEGDDPAPACLQRALRRGGIARTLRRAVSVDPKLVESVAR